MSEQCPPPGAAVWLERHAGAARQRAAITPSYPSRGHFMFDTLTAAAGGLSGWQAWEAGDSHLLVVVRFGSDMNGAA